MRVLVVEDDTRMATLLRRGLGEEGYAVDVAEEGPDAIWRATENAYDAVVLDVMLPGLDGFQVCERLRAPQRWAPVLMLTARDAVIDRSAGSTRRRRLSRQALQLRRADRTATRAGPPRRPAAARSARPPAICAWTRPPAARGEAPASST